MISAALPQNESRRIAALKSYDILDTKPEIDFDEITQLASKIMGTPISLVTLVDEDRQWFKSAVGLEAKETSRNDAFCAHAILDPHKPLVINNAYEDVRFHDNPLVTGDPHVVFYAGMPLVDHEGMALGSLCVIDHKPNSITDDQLKSLKILSQHVVKLIELKRTNNRLRIAEDRLKKINDGLSDFAHMISHDLKAPLRHIKQFSDILKDDINSKLDDNEIQLLDSICTSAGKASSLVSSVLKYSSAVHRSDYDVSEVIISDLIEDICATCQIPPRYKINCCVEYNKIYANKTVLTQVLYNLISNAIKYNDKPNPWIKINAAHSNDNYEFSVTDNGIGIPQKDVDHVCKLFYMVEDVPLESINRDGVGLNIVKKLLEESGGNITIKSTLGEGTTISIALPA